MPRAHHATVERACRNVACNVCIVVEMGAKQGGGLGARTYDSGVHDDELMRGGGARQIRTGAARLGRVPTLPYTYVFLQVGTATGARGAVGKDSSEVPRETRSP